VSRGYFLEKISSSFVDEYAELIPIQRFRTISREKNILNNEENLSTSSILSWLRAVKIALLIK
jgi:hypothetical protein